ncbi:MAG: glutaredoxin family protein [Nitrospinales bacterium]
MFKILKMDSLVKTFLLLIAMALLAPATVYADLNDPPWTRVKSDGGQTIRFHFFWSKACPHCRKAKPFITELGQSYDWLEVNSYEISENRRNAEMYMALAKKLGEENFAVPAFVFCEQVVIGYHNDQVTGENLRHQLIDCKKTLDQGKNEVQSTASKTEETKIFVPFFGELDSAKFSLPVFTIIIAGLDAFNPCAFFVLLLLLSMLVNVRNRRKMLLVGGIFVFFSGLIYFLFMAAWLNLFLYLGELRIITVVAALIAIGVSLINIKDYFFFKKGASLSIPDSAKPGLFARIRGLMKSASLPTMILGTIMLAIAANFYELLCTSGFPMIFTRMLTLNDLPSSSYYFYLALYNIIYVTPLTVIVLVFTITLGARKLSEKEGRILKLISGMMMLGLGLLLFFAPEMLSQLTVAVTLIAGSLILSCLIVYCDNKLNITGST